MPWFKVDDLLHGHPKAHRAGLAAMGMWALAGSYSSSYVTEGFIPEWWVTSFAQGKKRATELVQAGFWEVAEKNGEKGWLFHDWNLYQPSKAEIEAERAASRERQRRWRERNRNDATGQFENVSNGVTDGVTNATPSRPVPTIEEERDKSLSSSQRLVAKELNLRDDDERLQSVPQMLKINEAKKPIPWIKTCAKNGDLEQRLNEAHAPVVERKQRQAEIDTRKCPHGVVNGRRTGNCPKCEEAA